MKEKLNKLILMLSSLTIAIDKSEQIWLLKRLSVFIGLGGIALYSLKEVTVMLIVYVFLILWGLDNEHD